jgi:hypothetical protein
MEAIKRVAVIIAITTADVQSRVGKWHRQGQKLRFSFSETRITQRERKNESRYDDMHQFPLLC